ncbi:class A beta-lactamase-related serine hydrolase [Aquimarina sp. AD10]|uniref:serine hydrolase domain-containing protein n=1 Tax=Aquimarina sp. AD10 TaxID=1714849 RepID=UPI000E508517|nr:serine hydrolase domain-containing protein [Aquimarina sp. AD10]AXT61481.1 class A beta-lactamase-related serine hydrolase [Aquimarina sp. AD10]RKM89965.1 class A beta-lactamase-related serine hydrolase [Aquimarina sp. AD10]
MKKTIIILIIIIVLPTCFYLFEPILVYNTGWSPYPQTNQLRPVKQHKDSILKEADHLLTSIFNQLKTPAFSVAIGQNDKIIWSNAIGYQDIEKSIKANIHTKFRIGSTSKAVTSIGLGVLIQNNKLDFTTKVKEIIPYSSANLSEITVKQLASHTSGIRNYGTCLCFPIWEYYNTKEYQTAKNSIEVFNGDKLLFTPGSDFSYSSYNYTLLSAMIECVTKKEFPDFMKTDVFDPLKIHIETEKPSTNPKNLSKFYEVENNQYKEVFKVNNSNKWAGGGFIATPSDLVTLGNAFLNKKILNDTIVTSLIQPIILNNGKVNKQNYAIGWRNDTIQSIFNDKRDVQILHHAGVAYGATSVFILFPEYDLSISLLMNKSGSASDLFNHAYTFVKLFLSKS